MKINIFKITNDKVDELLVELERNGFVCEAVNKDKNSYCALYLRKKKSETSKQPKKITHDFNKNKRKGSASVNSTVNRRMGFFCILFSAIFLFNPISAFVDVLPDFFGYLLLYVGLYKLSDLNAHIEEARNRIRALLWVGLGQLFATYLLYGLMGSAKEINQYEQPTGILLCSFALLFFEWYFLIGAFRELFAGMDRLAEKHGSDLCRVGRKGKTKAQTLQGLSRLFVILSSLGMVLPELTILTSFEHDVNNQNFRFDWYDFVRMFRVLGVVIALAIGIVWLVFFIRYFVLAIKDRTFNQRLSDAYQAEIVGLEGLMTVRSFQAFSLLLQIGIVFAVQLQVSYYSILPGVGLALFSCIAVALISKRVHIRQRENVYMAGGLLALVSVAQCILNYLYLKNYIPEASLYQPTAYNQYLFVRVLGIAEALCTLLFVYVLLKMVLELVFTHTSVEYEGDVTHALSNAATARLHRRFEIRGMIALIFFAIAAVVNCFDAFFHLQYPWVWMIAFLCSFVAIWNFFAMLHEFMDQVKYRHQSSLTHKRH